ncbi:MAG TPA: DUF2268 domain-containing protein [Methanocella sp.]|jgi:uncharacterized protein YjaZ
MKFTVEDTASIYRKIIAEKDVEKKKALFRDDLLNPYEGLFNAFGGSLNPKQGQMDAAMFLQGWSFLLPPQLDEKALMRLEVMEKYHARDLMTETLDRATKAFEKYANRIPLEHIQAGIFLLDPAKMDPADHSYTGFGGVPGYVMMTYGEPDAYNMSKFQSALAHEIHHTIKFSTAPFNPMNISVGEYMILEGMAESFGTALYGKDRVGYYVEEFDMSQLPRVKETMKKALDLTGFNEVRSYLFGDRKTTQFGGKAIGMPDFAGYALGYFVVQAYMEKTGADIVETTFTPVDDIIRESGVFD